MKHLTTTLAALAVAAITLTGCSNAADDSHQHDASPHNADHGNTNDDQDQFTFGETYDGPLKTTIAAPEDFTTSAHAQPEGDAAAWKFVATYENTLDEPYPVAMLGVDGYSNDQKNSEVFDTAQGVGNAMETGEIAPGATAEVTYGFTGEPDADRRVVISSMDGSTQVTFTGDES